MSIALALSALASFAPIIGSLECPASSTVVLPVTPISKGGLIKACLIQLVEYQVEAPNSLNLVYERNHAFVYPTSDHRGCDGVQSGTLEYELVILPVDYMHNGDLRKYTCVPHFKL